MKMVKKTVIAVQIILISILVFACGSTGSTETPEKVEENMGLVYKVLGDKLKGQSAVGSYTREDLFQVGCIGLCKAAATDKGGRGNRG